MRAYIANLGVSMNTRDAFLQRVRVAVMEGNRAGTAPPLSERGRIGYQGAGPDPVERFCAELTAAGGQPFVAPDRAAALDKIQEIIQAHQARKIAVGCGGLLERLNVADSLRGDGREVLAMDAISAALFR